MRRPIPAMWLRICPECNRHFNLTDETDTDEWYNGHDCEDSNE